MKVYEGESDINERNHTPTGGESNSGKKQHPEEKLKHNG